MKRKFHDRTLSDFKLMLGSAWARTVHFREVVYFEDRLLERPFTFDLTQLLASV